MKRVRWLSSEKILPMNGHASPGEEKDLPDDVADKYIEQGEAVMVEEVKLQKRERVHAGDDS